MNDERVTMKETLFHRSSFIVRRLIDILWL